MQDFTSTFLISAAIAERKYERLLVGSAIAFILASAMTTLLFVLRSREKHNDQALR